MTQPSPPVPDARRAVVVHASDRPQDLERAVSTAGALRSAFPGVRVRIVVNGAALTGIPDFEVGRLPDDTTLAVCAVGLGRRGIEESTVPDGVEIVPAAPLAIAAEQFDGAAYIRL